MIIKKLLLCLIISSTVSCTTTPDQHYTGTNFQHQYNNQHFKDPYRPHGFTASTGHFLLDLLTEIIIQTAYWSARR